MKKSNFSLILFFLLFFSSSCDSSIFFSHEKEFSIYCINDFHGKVQSDSNQSGITKLSTYFKDKNDDNLILLSAGDMWEGLSCLCGGTRIATGEYFPSFAI